MPAVPETSSALQAQLTRIPPPDKKSGHKPSRTEKLKVWKKLGRHADPGEDAKSTQSDDGPPQLPTLASMQHRPLPPTPLAETNIPPRAPPTEQIAYQRRDLVLQPDAIYQSPQLAAAATADTTMPRRKLTSENLTRLVSADVHSSLGTGTIPIHLGNPSTPTRSQTLPTKLTETTPQSIESIKARANSFLLDEDPEDISSGSVVANGTVMLPHKRKTPEAVAATPDNRLEQRIWAVLREFYEEYPSMQGPEGETLEHAVDSLTLTLRRYDGQMKDKQNKIDDLDKQAKRLGEQTSRARSKADICRKALTAREAELTTKQRTVDEKSSEIQSLGRENSTLRAENRTLKADQESWIRTAQTNETLLRDRDRIKGMYDEKIKEAANERQYANQQELLLSAKNQVLTNEIQKYQGNVASLTSSNDVLRGKNIKLEQQLSTATQAESRKDQELRQLQADLDETRDLLAEERKTVMDKLAEQEEALRREHESHTWKLKSDAENLKKAIVARDHFKGLRDRDITGKFAKLATDIEDISTVEWDQSRASNWPVSEQEMDRLHRANTRLLKQHIVQNSVWLLLHKHVFQSPFTVMGTEGERLDTDWRDIYSSGKFGTSFQCMLSTDDFSRLSCLARALSRSGERAI